MKTNIRLENPNDYFTVEDITRDAFWNLYIPGCVEHLIVNNLRNHPDFIPELCFVMELDDEIVGSIFYSRSKVIDSDGKEYETISFGPVSIKPDLHRKGLGRQLITHSIEKAKELGYNAIIIGGFPYHYKTYGFEGAKKYRIAMPDNKYYIGIMALELKPGFFDHVKSGVVHFSQGMYPDESVLEDYDKQFKPLEKAVTEIQALFEKTVAELDTNDYQ